MTTKGFENVKSQIGFCGIWCGSCPEGNGAILELTRRLEQALKGSNPEYWVPKELDFKEFMKGLATIQTASLCSGCRKGGWRSNLPNKNLCLKKKHRKLQPMQRTHRVQKF